MGIYALRGEPLAMPLASDECRRGFGYLYVILSTSPDSRISIVSHRSAGGLPFLQNSNVAVHTLSPVTAGRQSLPGQEKGKTNSRISEASQTA